MSPTTRFRIVDILRKQQTASVHELSVTLDMTGANVRYHLAILEASELIEFIGKRREGRGRPENIYGLSRRVLGDGLNELAAALLEIGLRREPEELQEAGLRFLAMQMGRENPSEPDKFLPRRLTRMVDRLNELHYQARWEAGVDGARIILGHCPYAAIIGNYPELCRMDTILLEYKTGLPVDQIAKNHPSAKGGSFCIFRVTSN
jgi:predicted ArsR family transcriptional regulator